MTHHAQTPHADAPPPGGASAPDSATQQLVELWTVLFAQAHSLVESFGRLAKAEGALAATMVQERVRLFVGRQLFTMLALVLFAASAVFLSVFVWRGCASLTGQPWVGPLVLGAIYMLGAIGALAWRERLRL